MFAHTCTTLTRTLATLSLSVAGTAFLAGAAHAQGTPPVVIRFVATSGLDSNTCTRAAPCRTLQRGINSTADGGELQILNSGAYGNKATITRSITISAVGISATVGSLAIDEPGARVVLRGLLLRGRDAPDPDGIHVTNAAAVHIVGCEIEGFAEDGIRIESANTEVFVSDTIARGNTFSGFSATSDGTRFVIDNSRFEDNGFDGIFVSGSSKTAITRVVASGNGSQGIINQNNGRMNVTSTTAANNVNHGFAQMSGSSMTIEASVARGNGRAGLFLNGGGARVSTSVITNNDVGLHNAAGTMESRGNNLVRGNTSQTEGPITPIGGT